LFSKDKQWFNDLCLSSQVNKTRQILVVRIFTENQRKSYQELSKTEKNCKKRNMSPNEGAYASTRDYMNEGTITYEGAMLTTQTPLVAHATAAN
jgi:hypothetical protein